jgi:HK97 family phage portal protein
VNHQVALKYSPFWAAVRVISGTLAALPFLVYERLDNGGKQRKQTHPVYKLLHDRLNEYIDVVTFLETLQSHVLLYGNGYAEIQRDGAGRPIALWPLLPDKTQRKLSEDAVPYYEVRLPTGGSVHLPDYNVLHIKGLGFDGYTGYDVVTYHKETIGYGIAVKEYGARFFGNGANAGGVVEHPGKIGDKALKNLKESLSLQHEGLKNAHRVMILEENMKFNKTGIEPEKAQALEVQKWTVDDCSRIFQIPPHKLGSMEYSKYNNVEQLQIDFVTSTMYYWFRKWESECNYKLFMPSEQGRMFCEILVDGLLRGDMKSRFEAFAIGRQWGWYSVNDIRDKENMNPIGSEGDIYLEPLNMKPAGSEPELGPGDSEEKAFAKLIADTFQRVIVKRNREGFKSATRTWAVKIMAPVVDTVATLRDCQPESARALLTGAVNEYVRDDLTLEERHAIAFANDIVTKIGGNNHADS